MAKAATRRGKAKPAKSAPEKNAWRFRPKTLRRSFEDQLAGNFGEERLLSYVTFVSLAAFLAGLPSAIDAGQAMADENGVVMMVAGRFVAFVFFGPLFLYGLAAVSHAVAASVFQGSGTYKTARLALFWALVWGIPLVIANAIAGYLLRGAGDAAAADMIGIAIFLLWLWIWTSFFAIAEGFSRLVTYAFFLLTGFCIFGVLALLG